MTEEFRAGDEVKHLPTGRTGFLYDINPNPDFASDDEIWGELRALQEEWSETVVEVDDPKDLALLRRAADVPTAILPSLNDLRNQVASSLHMGLDDIRITETDPRGEPDGQFLAYGTSATGLPFGFRVTVSEVERTDF